MGNAHRSFWLDQAITSTAYRPSAPLRGDTTADVVIVGGGFCGMWSAYELKQRRPDLDVTVIERDICGGGASGRNAGYVLTLWAKFQSVAKIRGVDEAIRTCMASSRVIDEMEAFVAEHDIEADFKRNGWLWGATCDAQMGGWEPIISALDRTNFSPFEHVDKRRLREEWGLTGVLGAVLEAGCASVHPAKLAFELKRVLVALGVRFYEQTPMRSLRPGRSIEVLTDRGKVTAEKVVLAINAWGVAFAHIRKEIAVVAAQAAITKSDPDWIEKNGWSNIPAMTDSRTRVTNYRTTSDGRVEFGKGGSNMGFGSRVGASFEGPARSFEAMLGELTQAAPAAAALQVEKTWVGPIDRSVDGLPIFSHLNGDKRIVYGVGFTGNGVGPTKLGGKIIASLILEVDDEWSSLPLARAPASIYPPEPTKYIGGKVVRMAVGRRDMLENQNRKPSWPVRWLASQVRSGLVPSGPQSKA